MCEGENVFYIPSTDEILWITVIKDETPTFHGLSFEDIDSDLEKVIKEAQEEIATPLYFKALLEGQKISSNIEDKVGYLLWSAS